MSEPFLDELDSSLIELLQANARASYQEMATVTGASSSTVARRVTRLIDTGAITLSATPALLDPGEQQTALLGVAVDIGQLRGVAAALAEMSATRWVALVSGAYPLFARVVLPASASLVDFIVQEIASIPHVRDVQTFAVLETIKALDLNPQRDTMLDQIDAGLMHLDDAERIAAD